VREASETGLLAWEKLVWITVYPRSLLIVIAGVTRHLPCGPLVSIVVRIAVHPPRLMLGDPHREREIALRPCAAPIAQQQAGAPLGQSPDRAQRTGAARRKTSTPPAVALP
jgi:hypothetical protein